MSSKRTKKSKLELAFSEQNNMKKSDDSAVEASVEQAVDNGAIPSLTKAPKRKKKVEGTEVPKKVKKTNHETDPKKVKVRARKKSVVNGENQLNGENVIPENIKKSSKNDTENKKEEITWPEHDIIELINRIETNIPEKDSLAYRSRVEKLNWNNVAFNNYTSEECKKTWLQVQKRIRRFRLLREVLNDAKEWIAAPKLNNRLPRPKKHPGMPKRPLSSYLLFYLKKKDEIISENPGLDRSDISKLVGQIYKNLPPEIREQYEKTAASNKEEYLQKLKIFFDNHPEFVPPQRLSLNLNHKLLKAKPLKLEKEKLPTPEKLPTKVEKEKLPSSEKLTTKVEKVQRVEKEKTQKIKVKSKAKPARPPRANAPIERPPKNVQNAFGLYYASELKNMEPGTDKNAFRERCKQQYKQMSDQTKVYWINLAEQDLIRYQEEVKAYKAKYPNFKITKIKSVITKREKASKERASGKPVKPANSAYGLFSRVLLQSEEIKSVHPKDRMNYIANKWKNCPEEEQIKYRDKVVQLMEQYRKEFQAYLESLPEEERRKLTPGRKRRSRRARTSSGAIRKTAKRKPARKVQPPKPKFSEPEQPPISACKYFATQYKGDGDPGLVWKTFGPEEKRKYEEELVKKKQAYIVEFERFLKSLSKEELEAFSKSRQQQVQSDEDSSDCSSDSEKEVEDDDNEEEDGECDQNDEPHNNEGHDSDTD